MRRSFLYRTAIAFLCVAIMLLAAGCSDTDSSQSDEDSAAEGVYRIYYLNMSGTGLVRKDYRPDSENFDGILSELLDAFMNPEDENVRTALPSDVQINSAVTGINEVDLDFSAEYLSLDTITEILLRSALVKTMLQLPGVDTVRFTVDSQSLVIGGSEIGAMTDDTFIVPEGNSINSYRNQTLILYFPGADGISLIRELRTVYYSSNIDTPRLVAEQLIQGSDNSNLLDLTTEEVLVNSVKVRNSVCTIDFSSEVNDLPFADSPVDPETVLYAFTDSIIDSVTDRDITAVRFLIDGSDDVRFRDQVSLDQEFTRNSDLINASGTSVDQEVMSEGT